jgi:signal transduction histidine kinase
MTDLDSRAGTTAGTRVAAPVQGRLADRVRVACGTPFTTRAARELLFCLIGVGFGLAVVGVPFAISGTAFAAGFGSKAVTGGGAARSAAGGLVLIGIPLVLVALLILAPLAGRRLGTIHRRLAARLLHRTIQAPAPLRSSGGWGASLRDGAGWRAIGYSLLKLPLAVLEAYAVVCFAAGLVNVTYPFWWRLFRNHAPEVHLSAVPVITPFGGFHVTTWLGTFAALAAGVAMVLVAPWIARGATTLDAAAMRALLGPGRLAQRVADLQASRAQAIDENAATLRRLERDLHDGAQIRLATLAMNLGMAAEKLGADGAPPDLDQARDLVAAAHSGAKATLVELRDLVRGIHPPVLDNGLGDALETLASASAIPVALAVDLPIRPSPAIETIAYFCTTELLANAAKHSHANQASIELTGDERSVRLIVIDDGVGGADPVRGTGLTGLSQRVRAVDGRIGVASPAGGPTTVAVELPLRA